MKMLSNSLILIVFGLFAIGASANTTFDKLQYVLGDTQYLILTRNSETNDVLGVSLLEKSVTIETKDNEDVVKIVQKISSDNRDQKAIKTSLNRLSDFKPIRHHSLHGQVEKTFVYQQNKIINQSEETQDSVTDDLQSYNWEADIDLFQLLAKYRGAELSIPFYQPGGSMPPRVYQYKVVDEILEVGYRAEPVKCRKFTYQIGDNYTASYYIDIASGLLVRFEDQYGNIVREKVPLSYNGGTR